MSYSVKNSISGQENGISSSSSSSSSSSASSQLKIYQAFIFSVPIFFTFVLLFLFYCFYLRRRRADWSSLRMRANPISATSDDISRCEVGLKKELREMLPIIVFKESFSVKDTQCSVCLGEDRLQQIPACGHTFHMDCIHLWLTTHTTCPLCRQSLLATTTHQHHQDHPLQLQIQITEQHLPPHTHTHTDDHEPPLDESTHTHTHTHTDAERGVLEILK